MFNVRSLVKKTITNLAVTKSPKIEKITKYFDSPLKRWFTRRLHPLNRSHFCFTNHKWNFNLTPSKFAEKESLISLHFLRAFTNVWKCMGVLSPSVLANPKLFERKYLLSGMCVCVFHLTIPVNVHKSRLRTHIWACMVWKELVLLCVEIRLTCALAKKVRWISF